MNDDHRFINVTIDMATPKTGVKLIIREIRPSWVQQNVKIEVYSKMMFWQESPPAWTQEAYRPPCSKYSLCCPNWVPLPGYPPILTWLGGTLPGFPLGRVPPQAGYPPPPAGYSPLAGPGRVPPPHRCLPHGILGNVAKHYGIWVPPLWTDRQTRVKTLPFPSYYVRGR